MINTLYVFDLVMDYKITEISSLEYLEEQNWNSDAVELFVEKDIREESKIKDWIEILSATISIKILSEKFPNYNKLVADDEMKSITI